MTNWDTETADKCKLPELIEGICEQCRDYDYCHRQLSFYGGEQNEQENDIS